MPGYRIRVTAQLSACTAVDVARLRAQTGAVVKPLAAGIVAIEIDAAGTGAQCAADRALRRIEAALAPAVRLTRSATWVARRRGALGLRRRTTTGRWFPGGDDDGLAGVREPRRPAPTAGSACAAVDPRAA